MITNFKNINDKVENMDLYLKTVNQLFWAYYSGSQDAGKQLEIISKEYQSYDGGVSEEFDSIISSYKMLKGLEN